MTTLSRIDRRTALKWMIAATASAALGQNRGAGKEWTAAPRGYGTDPDLLRIYGAGELWPLTFTDIQRLTAAALCDVIIPADDYSPSASAVGLVDFIDEWISAPYTGQVKDRGIVLEGLAWIDAEAWRRKECAFPELAAEVQAEICDSLCLVERAVPSLRTQARFFARFRDLTAGGFYTTAEGTKDLRYIGNMPLITFDGPPPEVLRQLGLDES